VKLLIIEDEHKIAQALKTGFEQEHFVVDVAFDGESGFDLAIMGSFDLIVLDRLLPKMDGLKIIENLRKKNNHTPVIILTAKTQVVDKVEGLTVGADDYVTKPFAFEELLARVKALIRRPLQIQKTKLQVGGLILDTENYEVKRGDKIIKLSAKEFSLLEYLMRHVDITMSKSKITRHVWNYDTDILPNTVEVFIGYLRKKIDKNYPKREKLIHTVRGFGYRLGIK